MTVIPPSDEFPPVSPVSAGLMARCPRCGNGKLFRGFLTLAPACSQCGLDYAFVDAGDGPAVFVTLLAGTVAVGAALYIDAVYEPPIWVHLVVSLPLTVLLCLSILRPTKGLLVALQYKNKAEQSHFE